MRKFLARLRFSVIAFMYERFAQHEPISIKTKEKLEILEAFEASDAFKVIKDASRRRVAILQDQVLRAKSMDEVNRICGRIEERRTMILEVMGAKDQLKRMDQADKTRRNPMNSQFFKRKFADTIPTFNGES